MGDPAVELFNKLMAENNLQIEVSALTPKRVEDGSCIIPTPSILVYFKQIPVQEGVVIDESDKTTEKADGKTNGKDE